MIIPSKLLSISIPIYKIKSTNKNLRNALKLRAKILGLFIKKLLVLQKSVASSPRRGAHKHFFDTDARLSSNSNYPQK